MLKSKIIKTTTILLASEEAYLAEDLEVLLFFHLVSKHGKGVSVSC